MFPLDLSYLRPSLGDDNRLYFRYRGYVSKVLGIENADLISYWVQNEASGTNADNAEGTAARDGTYTGVTLGQPGIGDGLTAPLYDGANDYLDVYSASLNSVFDGDEGTVAAWIRVSGAGVWTDGAARIIFQILANGTNYLFLRKDTANNTLRWVQRATNEKTRIKGSVSDTDWFHVALTWSAAADEVKAYYGGVQEGATLTGLGTWSGAISSTQSLIGAANKTPVNVWDGYLAHVPFWKKALSSADILSLATV